MNPSLLNTESQEFIHRHLHSTGTDLILKGTSIPGVETNELVEQIEAKKRSEKKLPTWFNQQNIYYPNKLNIEQASSEITANYKASLIKGKAIIDLTGGFGVDCHSFSESFTSVVHCEIDTELSKIVSHNFKQLNRHSIETVTADGIAFLERSNKTYDWIYVDPSRRHDRKGKVFFLEDCLPNIPRELSKLFNHSNNIMIKTSPLLDISVGISELKNVKTVHVVAINNEVKELLWILQKGFYSTPIVKTINIKSKEKERFEFAMSDESKSAATYSMPLSYLYEPNSAILKAGAFNSVSSQLKVDKLHKHSHLYTSNTKIDFPGRCFRIENCLQYHKKQLKKSRIHKANITTRNFPESVQQIRNTLKIKDGGHLYLFFTTNVLDEKVVLFCTKVE